MNDKNSRDPHEEDLKLVAKRYDSLRNEINRIRARFNLTTSLKERNSLIKQINLLEGELRLLEMDANAHAAMIKRNREMGNYEPRKSDEGLPS